MNLPPLPSTSMSKLKPLIAENPQRLTPIMFTFSDADLTSVDIKKFLDLGLKHMSFRLAHMPHEGKEKMMSTIQRAILKLCNKLEVNSWPVTLSLDIPNHCIRTGYLKEENVKTDSITLQKDSIVIITCQLQYWNKCDDKRICIDDSYILSTVKLGTNVIINFGEIVMVCKDRLDPNNIKCEVVKQGQIKSEDNFFLDDTKLMKPILSKMDMELLEFAKEFKFDCITMNSVRQVGTLKKVRDFFRKEQRSPSIISTIREQDGLANIDAIIEESDGIILAREYLVHKIRNQNKMAAIQLQIGAKCKKRGKPFFISGNILEETLLTGVLTGCDNNDITNIILQRSGVLMNNCNDPNNVIKAVRIINSVCEIVEPLIEEGDFWRLHLELKMPVNAAEACMLSCVILAKCSQSAVIIVPTVTGRTIKQLVLMAPNQIILAITTNPYVANQLLLYRGVIPIIYEQSPHKDWYIESQARIDYAIAYGIHHNYLNYGQLYVTLRKSFPYSGFCDNVSVWEVITEETKKRMVKVGNKLLKTTSGSHIDMM